MGSRNIDSLSRRVFIALSIFACGDCHSERNRFGSTGEGEMNVTSNEPQIVLLVRFRAKAGKKEEFRKHLYGLVERMRTEKAWINTIVHEDHESEDIVLYETWRGTKESWLAEEYPRPYRAPYEDLVKELLDDRQVTWLVPTAAWRG